MQVTITNAKLELLQQSIILMNVQRVENIEVSLFGNDQGISEKLLH